MAFGISREELRQWKHRVSEGEIAFITHYWVHPRFPQYTTVTKVGCADRQRLMEWAAENSLRAEWIHDRPPFPHFDLIGEKQIELLYKYEKYDQIKRFGLEMK